MKNRKNAISHIISETLGGYQSRKKGCPAGAVGFERDENGGNLTKRNADVFALSNYR